MEFDRAVSGRGEGMPQIIWDTAEIGLCRFDTASMSFTYCNPLHVGIALAIAIIVAFVVVWIAINYSGGCVREP